VDPSNHLQTRFSRLLVYQRVARRFQSECEVDFERLRACRDAVADVVEPLLARAPMQPEDSVHHLASWLNECFWLFELRDGRRLVREGDPRAVAGTLKGATVFPFWNLVEDESEFFVRLIVALQNALAVVEDLTSRYNYFDYVPILVMASVCEGEVLHGLHHVLWADLARENDADPFVSEAERNAGMFVTGLRWISHCLGNLDAACAWFFSGVGDRYSSREVIIFDSARNPLVLRSDGDSRAMYMRISLEQAPSEIDRALCFLRDALVSALGDDRPPAEDAVGWREFEASRFFREFSSRPRIVTRQDELEPGFMRLWLWDLHNRSGRTFDAAAAVVSTALGKDGSERAYNNQNEVRKITMRGLLDEAVTGKKNLFLGLRQDASRKGGPKQS
jgi:hypothetical protein